VQCVKFGVVLFEMWGTKWPMFQLGDYYMTVKVTLSLCRPGQAPGGYRRFRLPGFLEDWHIKVARLSALRTGRLYHLGDIFYLFLRILEAESTPGP